MGVTRKKAIVAGVVALLAICLVVLVRLRAQDKSQPEQTTAGIEASDGTASDDSGDTEASTVDLTTSTAPVGDNARDAQTATETPTAAQVYEETTIRGFDDAKVQASFDLEGNYHDLATLDEASDSVWPSYNFEHVSPHGILWMVYINDGMYIAVPLSHNGEALSHQLIFTEHDYVTQYDGLKNEYSDFAFDELPDDVTGIRVDSLNAATLDSYTFEQLEAM